MNDLIHAKIKEILKLQDITKKDDLSAESNNFGKYSHYILFF